MNHNELRTCIEACRQCAEVCELWAEKNSHDGITIKDPDERKVGRAFVYRAAATRDELEGAVAAELVQSLFDRPGNGSLPLLSTLVDAVSERDRALLDDLERLIQEKRRAIGGKSR